MSCSLTCGVRFTGFLSILLACAVIGTSAWLLKTNYEKRESTANKIFNSAATVLQYNSNRYINNLIWVTATTLAAGSLQLITSLFLLFCSSSKGGRVSSKLWLFINFFTFLATAGAFVCLMSQVEYRNKVQNDDDEHQLKGYLGAVGLDAVFILLFSFVTGTFSCRSE